MQKLKKVLKSLVKTKSKKPEKSAKKDSSKKPAVKIAKPKAKAAEKPVTAKKAVVAKAVKKENPLKKAAKLSKPAPKAKLQLKPEIKIEHKPEAKKTAKLEKPKASAVVKAALPEKAPAERVAEKPKAKVSVPKAPKEEVIPEAKREYVDEEIFLTDAEGRRYCRVKECDQVASVDAYCRYHYLLFWKKIQVRKKILTEGKLERYVEELTARYPDKYLEMLRKDLRSEKDFLSAIQELELDDNSGENELEDEAQSYIEEVRGMSSEGGSSRDDDEF